MEDGDTTSNISSVLDVPPYLKEQYTPLREVFESHTATLPSRKSPESNSDAVIRSLKALQEKIQSLEVERVAAANRFKLLSQRTSTVPMVTTTAGGPHASSSGSDSVGTDPTKGVGLRPQMDTPDVGTSPWLRDTTSHAGLKSRLDSLDERLTQQAQDLDAMQQRLRVADMSTPSHPHTPTPSHPHTPTPSHPHTPTPSNPHTPTPSHLQGECKCSATDKKLRSLEQGVTRLKEAQLKTKEKVEQLETCIEHSPRGRDTVDGRRPAHSQAKKRVKPKAKKTKAAAQRSARKGQSANTCSGGVALKCVPHPLPGVHYRLDMRDVPFILGSSTTPSHSVSVNYQQVLSMMKAHNHLLCGAAALSVKKKGQQKSVRGDISKEELEVLLAGLEEEYGALTFEHQALAQHLDKDAASQKPRVRASLELQLKHLEEQLESKAEQIQIVSKQLTSRTARGRGPKTSPAVTLLRECVEETTDDGPKDSDTQKCFLKKMKALQSTLQRDDLNWR